MERVSVITHKGASILKVDLSHTTSTEENLETLAKARAMIDGRPPKSMLILTDVTKCVFNPKSVEALKDFAKFNTPHVKASAVLGVVGIYRIIYEAVVRFVGRDLVCFDTEEEALDWLASHHAG